MSNLNLQIYRTARFRVVGENGDEKPRTTTSPQRCQPRSIKYSPAGLNISRDCLSILFSYLPLHSLTTVLQLSRSFYAQAREALEAMPPAGASLKLSMNIRYLDAPSSPLGRHVASLRLSIFSWEIQEKLEQIHRITPALRMLHLTCRGNERRPLFDGSSSSRPVGAEEQNWRIPMQLEIVQLHWEKYDVATEDSSSWPPLPNSLLQALSACPLLTKLSLRFDVGRSCIREALNPLLSLHHLDSLRNCTKLTSLEMPMSADQLEYFTRTPHSLQLKHFVASHGSNDQQLNYKTVTEAFHTLPSLTQLKLATTSVSFLATHHSLTALHLYFTEAIIRREVCISVAENLSIHLPKLNQLRCFKISFPRFFPVTLCNREMFSSLRLAASLQHCTQLTSLSLRWSVGSAALMHLLCHLPLLKKLEHRVEYCYIDCFRPFPCLSNPDCTHHFITKVNAIADQIEEVSAYDDAMQDDSSSRESPPVPELVPPPSAPWYCSNLTTFLLHHATLSSDDLTSILFHLYAVESIDLCLPALTNFECFKMRHLSQTLSHLRISNEYQRAGLQMHMPVSEMRHLLCLKSLKKLVVKYVSAISWRDEFPVAAAASDAGDEAACDEAMAESEALENSFHVPSTELPNLTESIIEVGRLNDMDGSADWTIWNRNRR